LFVFPDQMRGTAMGFLGKEPVLTPRLDRFSAESLVLTQAASNFPVCSPYRAMLMSGKYSPANRVLGNCFTASPRGRHAAYHSLPLPDCELQESDRCWSDVLHDQGYSLGYVGKWHLDMPHEPFIVCANNTGGQAWNEWCPPHRRHGFDYWYSYGTYDEHHRPMYWETDTPREGFRFVDQWSPEHEADRAIDYLRNEGGRFRDPEKPFALVVSNNPPHMPYHTVPDRYRERYAGISTEELCERSDIPPVGSEWGDHYRRNIRDYYAAITGVDEQFGRILDTLDELGLSDDTIVVFTSDHGECLGIHNHPDKGCPYEASMHVPFMIRWPGKISPRHDDLLLSTPDIYPTLIDLMGLKGQIPQDVQGVSHADVFLTGEGERPSSQLYLCLWHDPANPSGGARGVRTERYTYVEGDQAREEARIMLFDREVDPFELHNLAPERPDLIKCLHDEELVPWLMKTNDPFQSRLAD
jgi:arylsulfatase A-like enzyme